MAYFGQIKFRVLRLDAQKETVARGAVKLLHGE
jgi:hypothetical protein